METPGSTASSFDRHANRCLRIIESDLGKSLATVAVGAIALVVMSQVYDVASGHAGQIALTTCLSGVAATVIGVFALHFARHRSIGTQVAVLSACAMSGLGFGVWLVAHQMFLDAHDFAILMVMLMTAMVTAVLGSIALGRRVNSSIEALATTARNMVEAQEPSDAHVSHPSQLARLDSLLQETSMKLSEERMRSQGLERSRRDLVAWLSGDLKTSLDDAQAHLRVGETDEVSERLTAMQNLVTDLLELNSQQVNNGINLR